MSLLAEALQRADDRMGTATASSRPSPYAKYAPETFVDQLPFPNESNGSANAFGTQSEAQAIHDIGAVLSRIATEEGRARVLRAVHEIYCAQTTSRDRADQTAAGSTESMIHDFVREFQQLVNEWHATEREAEEG